MGEKYCCFTGHRPNKLYGYNLADKRYQTLAKTIRFIILNDLIPNECTNFISGGALGLDTVAFFVVDWLKKNGYPNIKNILAIPFENQSIKWINKTDLERYERMKESADEIIYVDTIEGYKNLKVKMGEYHIEKLNKRNEYMVDVSQYIISVWDGSRSGTKNCIDYAESKGLKKFNINPGMIKEK